MGRKDQRVDRYVADAPEFARPVLKKLRALIHRADGRIDETIKWGVPHFEKDGIVAGMAAFQRHVAFGFWKGPLMKDEAKLFSGGARQSAFSVKVTGVADLPADRVIVAYVKEAVALNESGAKTPRAAAKKKPPPRAPADLRRALDANAKAREAFDAFPPSHKREYVEWITEAKRDDTRARRVAQAVAWMADGKSRNWKYERPRTARRKT